MYLKYVNAWHNLMILGQISISTVLKIDEIKKVRSAKFPHDQAKMSWQEMSNDNFEADWYFIIK